MSKPARHLGVIETTKSSTIPPQFARFLVRNFLKSLYQVYNWIFPFFIIPWHCIMIVCLVSISKYKLNGCNRNMCWFTLKNWFPKNFTIANFGQVCIGRRSCFYFQHTEEYKAVNPIQQVPSLVIDGHTFSQSVSITW